MERISVAVPVGEIRLTADVAVPDEAQGLVLFAHGSGSGRNSPRNRFVAGVLNHSQMATVLIDLLTPDEEQVDVRTAELRFDIPLLAQRLIGVVDWISGQPVLSDLGLGFFGASTGSAAALTAAAQRPDIVKTVVSRGGRPDLAGASLKKVLAPTLFIVGGNDTVVLDLNHSAMTQLPRQGDHKLEIVAGATHLFEEAGALEKVAALAADWFRRFLHDARTAPRQ